MTQLELANWMALYLATAMCCAIALALSCAMIVREVYRDRSWAGVDSIRSALLFVPRTWWRWQKLYLTSTPMTLVIVSLFAGSMTWS